LILVNELYIYNKPCPHMHERPPPLGEPEPKKNRFRHTNFNYFRDQQNHEYVI